MHADGYVDMKGSFCQAPLFLLKEGMDRLTGGWILKVEADSPATVEDAGIWAKRTGHGIVLEGERGGMNAFRPKNLKE
jgi:tRNA 2-thiouridine synthesizing protein A